MKNGYEDTLVFKDNAGGIGKSISLVSFVSTKNLFWF